MNSTTAAASSATLRTALDAVADVHAALAAAGLPRTSRYSGGEMTGWTACFGSTGFSIREDDAGDLVWHVVVSGKPHLTYREYRDDGGGHEPIAPERLCPRIEAVFRAQGLDVRSVRYGGHQTMWDDDVEYNVVTARPDWLEPTPDASSRRMKGWY